MVMAMLKSRGIQRLSVFLLLLLFALVATIRITYNMWSDWTEIAPPVRIFDESKPYQYYKKDKLQAYIPDVYEEEKKLVLEKLAVLQTKPESDNITFDDALKKYTVIGDADKQNNEYGKLKPNKYRVVPNIAHFVWFSCHEFTFVNLLSLLSVFEIMKADMILFHTDCEPKGEWWEIAKKRITNLEIVAKKPPIDVFGVGLTPRWPQHKSDVARLHILSEMGGVYLDPDIIILAPLTPLRYYDCVLARHDNTSVTNGIMVAKKGLVILDVVYDSYRSYDPSCYSCSSSQKLNQLVKEYSHLVHIEPNSLVKPGRNQWKQIFDGHFDWKRQHFSIHAWIQMYTDSLHSNPHLVSSFNADNIKQLNTTFGEIARFVYYGSPDYVTK